MAEKISVQIALEGGAAVVRQLEGISEAGQKAFDDIAKSAEEVGGFKNVNPEAVTAKLKELGIEGTAAFDKIQQAVKSAARFETVVQGVQGVETALAALGRAAIPAAAAIAVGFQAAAKATIGFAESINKANDQAVNLGMNIEQFDKLRGSLQNVGLSGKAVGSAFEGIKKAVDAAELEKVQKAFEGLKNLAEAGIGPRGSQQLLELQRAARGVGPAADAARKALEQLGAPIPTDVPKTLKDFVAQTGSARAAIEAFIAQLQAMPDSATRSALATQQLGQAGTELIRILQTGAPVTEQFKQGLAGLIDQEAANRATSLGASIERLMSTLERFGSVALAPVLVPGIDLVTAAIDRLNAAAAKDPWGGLLRAASLLNPVHLAIQALEAAVVSLGSSLLAVAWEPFAQAAVAAFNQVVLAVQGAGAAVANFASSLASIAWDTISGGAVAAWNAVTAAIQNAINKLLELIGLGGPATTGGDGGAVPGIAHGGVIGGRGTGTSDSNLAWVSRGEHIMPARAVAQPGVLAFLEALRRSGGNLRHVLDGMGRFALGGLVPRPAFAGGGAVGSMSNVTINFPGLQPIGGLRASAEVVDQLQKAAALAQVRSGGRKPSRYS